MKRLVYLFATLMLLGCTTTKYVEVERIKTDTIYQKQLQLDSIWLHDSIYFSEKGDTIRIEKWHTKYVERLRVDTCYIATHDTIPKPYPVEVKVPAQLSWIQQAKQHLANAVLWLIAIVVVIYVGKGFFKL